jgi:hypothetical protein
MRPSSLFVSFFLLLILWLPDAVAQPGRVQSHREATSPTPQTLATLIRGYVLHALPDPMYEKSTNWGRTAKSFRGVKKQGLWRKTRVTALDPKQRLVVEVRDLKTPEPGRLTFSLHVALDARAEHWRQRWAAGIKVFDTSIRARFHIRLTVNCEATFHMEPGALLLPEAVVRFRVIQSHAEFDHLVVEHIVGLGGEAAEIIGDIVHNGLRQWRPSLERNLLARAEAAILKAGKSKEVRVSLWQAGRVKKVPSLAR